MTTDRYGGVTVSTDGEGRVDEALALLRRWDRRWAAAADLLDRHHLWSGLWAATDDDSTSMDTDAFLARFPEQEDTTND